MTVIVVTGKHRGWRVSRDPAGVTAMLGSVFVRIARGDLIDTLEKCVDHLKEPGVDRHE